MDTYNDIFKALAAPFQKDEVKVRPQAGRQLQYVTARTVMNRLDNVLGPENWWDDYSSAGEDSILCRLTIRLAPGVTLTKCDAGGFAGMADQGDDDKSGYSDAFKRAAVKFGVARYLYRDGVPSYIRERSTPDVSRGNPGSPSQVPIQAPPQPTQVSPEPESKGLTENLTPEVTPFDKVHTFWNDILDGVARINSAYLQDHPDSEEIVTTDSTLKHLFWVTWDGGLHTHDPNGDLPQHKQAAVLNKLAKAKPENMDWMKQHLDYFMNQQLQAALKLDVKGTRGPR